MRVYAWTCVCAHACMHVCVRACTSLCACMCECRQKGFQVWTILKQPVSYELFPFDICINVWGHGTDGTKQEHCPKMHSHGSITNCWYTGVVVVVFTSWSLGITRYIQLYTDNCTLIKAFHRWVDCLCDRFLLPHHTGSHTLSSVDLCPLLESGCCYQRSPPWLLKVPKDLCSA